MALARENSLPCPACSMPIRFRPADVRGRLIDCPACDRSLAYDDEAGLSIVGDPPKEESARRSSFIAVAAAVLCLLALVVGYNAIPTQVEVREAERGLIDRLPPSLPIDEPDPAQNVVKDWQEPERVDERPVRRDQPLMPAPIAKLEGDQSTLPAENAANDGSTASSEEPIFDWNRPIDVPVVSWDPEAEPIAAVVAGALGARSEARLGRQLDQFETSEPASLRTLVETLAELAGVPVRMEGRWPEQMVTARFSTQTVRAVIDELLARYHYIADVSDDGWLVIRSTKPSVAQESR